MHAGLSHGVRRTISTPPYLSPTMSTHQPAIRTESAGISTARQSLDNVLSAKASLEQTPSSPENSADKHCALEFQIAELEGMLTEITDERFARTVDESQLDDENRNMGLLNFIIDTADNILASLSPTSNTPPPTYQRSHINIQPTQSNARKPKVESRDSSFPLPHDQMNSKQTRSLHTLFKSKSKVSKADHPTSTNAAAPSIRSVPAKLTNNRGLVGSSKPLPNPSRRSGKSREGSQDSSIDDLSLSAFQALKTSDAFKTLLDRTESKHTNEIDRDNLWFSFREAFGNNLSKELLCAFDVLIRISSFECSSKDTTNPGRASAEEPTPRFNNKGKAPLRSVPPNSGTRSPFEPINLDFVTIESPTNTQSPQHNNNAKSTTIPSSLPPPYSQHIVPTVKNESVPCVNCNSTIVGHDQMGLEVHCGHVFCANCVEKLIKEYIQDGSLHPLRCRCNERMRKVDLERFILSCKSDEEERQRLVFLFRDRYDQDDALRSSGRL